MMAVRWMQGTGRRIEAVGWFMLVFYGSIQERYDPDGNLLEEVVVVVPCVRTSISQVASTCRIGRAASRTRHVREDSHS